MWSLLKLLKQEIKNKMKKQEIPVYDPEKEAVYDINDISKILPHKYPFLLVDKIIELSKRSCSRYKKM